MEKLVVKLPFTGRSLRNKITLDILEKKVTSKERVRKHREKLKTDPKLMKKLEEHKTKKIIENQNYRQRVQELRNQNPKYNEEIKAKERMRKQRQRQKKKAELKKRDSQMTSPLSSTKKKIPSTVRNAANTRKQAERARKALPKEPRAWADTVSHIIKTSTPRRKSMLNTHVDNKDRNLHEIDSVIGVNKVGRPKACHEHVKKQLAFSEMSNLWRSRRSQQQYLARKKTQSKILSKPAQHKDSWRAEIEQFLEDNSRVMPNKKDTVNINGTPVAKRHLLSSKLQLYMKFKKLYPKFGRKFTTFFRLIPKNYKKLDLTCRRVCVCSKDYNLDQKIEALNKLAKVKSLSDIQATARQLSTLTVCPFEDQPNRSCVERKCTNCGTDSIPLFYAPLLAKCTGLDKIKFHLWESLPETYTNKEGKKINSKRWMQALKTETPEAVVKAVIDDMYSFTPHLFRADFQYRVETELMTNIPPDHCVAVMDFSENISLQSQDEIESAHWTTKQVTLHPIYIVRHAADSTSDKPRLIKESLIILSDSLSHNSKAVYVYTNQLMLHLKSCPGPCEIKFLHRFSDNCATQYKCKEAFGHISTIEEAHGISLIYHYTESGHGKGPSDGLGAAIKARLQRMILGGKVINNAYEAYLALVQTQQQTVNQRVIFVPQQKLTKQIPPNKPDLKTVKGTHSFHMVRTIAGEPGVLECRDLSCSCMVCIAGHEGPCYLSKYRHEPQRHFLLNKTPSRNAGHSSKVITNQGEGAVDRENNSQEHSDCVDLEQGMQQSLKDHNSHVAQNINTMSVFSNSIANKGWQIRGVTPEDGNCCFWAISDQLDYAGVGNVSQVDLRQNVVKYIEDFSEAAKAEMTYFLTTSFNTYLQKMGQDGTYADHICLQTMSKMLSSKIRIVHAAHDDVNLLPTDTSTCTLVLGYIPEIQHYVSLEPLMRFKMDDFVAVVLSQRRRKHLYIAKVLQVDTDEVKLKYLQSDTRRSKGIYMWPDNEDISWQPHTDVLKKLKPPQLVPGRGLKLKFDLEEISKHGLY